MKTIRVLQHASFEGPAGLAGLALERGFELAVTRLDLGQPLPELATSGAVVVLGGPMSVHDEQAYPWLLREKRWIASAVDAGIPVVGICLGAQLLAHVLGATVSAMHEREIGWHRVDRAPEAAQALIGSVFPPTMLAFHWHGDTFALPAGAVRLASSEACREQAFALGDRVLGLQFHLETIPAAVRDLVLSSGGDLDRGGRFVQSEMEMFADHSRFEALRPLLARIVGPYFELSRS